MDPVTHTLVGVGLANAFFRDRPRSALILALASNAPDIDVLVHLTADPAAITLRRSFGHSLFALPLVSLALAALLRWRLRQDLIPLWGLCLLGCAAHVLFDLVNSFGVLLLWPLSPWRPELAMIFIIDLALTGLLAAPFVLSRFWGPRRESLFRAAMACVLLYVTLCWASRQRAWALLQREERGAPADFSYVFPEPLGAHRWRGVIRRGNGYRVHLVNSLTGQVELITEAATDSGEARVEAARLSPMGRRLEAFFKAPVWSFEAHQKGGGRVRVYDLRFRSVLVSRAGAFEFVFASAPDGTAKPLGWASGLSRGSHK